MTILANLYWEHAWAFLLMPFPVVVYVASKFLRIRTLTDYADQALLAWVIPPRKGLKRSGLRPLLYILGWICLVIALAGPKTPMGGGEYQHDMDIMLLVDVSRSMSAMDNQPNRLQRAKLEIIELLEMSRRVRFGMVVFAARAHLYVPLTYDRNILRYYVGKLDRLVLPTRGSEVNTAIALGNDILWKEKHQGAMVLVSDGEYQSAPSLPDMVKPIYVLGLGSASGSGIPAEEGKWLEYDSRPVLTRMQENNLQQIADRSHGAYHRASIDDSDWQYLYASQIDKNRIKQNADSEQQWQQWYWLPLAVALALLYLVFLPFFHNNAVRVNLIIVSLLLVFSPPAARASSSNEIQAYRYLKNKDYQSALDVYQHMQGFQQHFGKGIAYYLQNKLYAAQTEFSQAVVQANDDKQRVKALFNLANTHFHLGDYEMAIQLYQNTLLYKPDFQSAKNNLTLAETLWDLVLKNLQQIELNVDNSPGFGPQQQISRAQDIDNLNASLAIANEDKSKLNLPKLPSLKKLVTLGIEQIRIATSGSNAAALRYRQLKIDSAKLSVKKLQSNDAQLWKSLFEIEEGFAAPQSKPVEIPGIHPW